MKTIPQDEVDRWLRWIEFSRSWREEKEKTWARMVGYLKGKFLAGPPPEDYVCVNLVHPAVRVIVPAIYSKNPDLIVKPRKRGYEEGAKAMAMLLRYFMDELDLKREVKLCLVDAILTGHAWLKVGYQVDFEEVEEAHKTVKQRMRDAVKEGKKALKAIMGGAQEYEAEKSTYHLQADQRIVGERPWVRRVSPFDMFVPAYSKREDDLPWKAECWVRDIEDIKKDPEIKVDIEEASGDARRLLVPREKMHSGAERIYPDEDEFMQYVVGYEIWDARTNCIYNIADINGTGKLLNVKENVYAGIFDSRDGYEMLRFNEVTDDFYPTGEIESWEAQIHELNDTRTQQITHRKRFNRRYVYLEGAFKPEDIDRWKAGDDGTMIPTTEEAIDKTIWAVQDAQLPGDVYAAEERIKADINEISGITGYQRGTATTGADSATEAAIVEHQSQYRTNDRIEVVGAFAERVVRKIAQVSQLFLPLDEISSILGDDAIFWINLKDKKQIRGEFTFKVVYGSSSPISVEAEQTQASIMYRELIQNPLVNPAKITADYIRAMGKLDPESYLIPEVAAMMEQARIQQAAMMAMQGMMMEQGQGSGLVDPYGAPVQQPGQKGSQIGEFGTPSPASMLSSLKRTGDQRPPGSQGGGSPII